jgi:hypothetical protein
MIKFTFESITFTAPINKRHHMKKTMAFVLLLIVFNQGITAQQLLKIWETDTLFKVPESTLYDTEEQVIFVSSINGKSNEKDSNGFISKLGRDGKLLQLYWATGFHAPKGMATNNGHLYVADLDEVVVLERSTGKTVQRISVPGAVFLNDIAIQADGTLFVSDTRTGKIHRVKDGRVSLMLENKTRVNGLLASGNELIIAAKDTLWKMDRRQQLSKITDGMDESSDGIVETADKDFIVSCWAGIIYYVHKDGSKKILLDSRAEKINTADIGFDAANNILYVPTFFTNKVMAYRLVK